MSRQYNKTIFIGHLGGEPEMRFTPSGTPVTIFNAATHDQYPNEKGEIIKVTTWFRCTAWGKLAEICKQYLQKGSRVLIEGRLIPDKSNGRPRIWTRHDGTAAADYELKIQEIHFLDPRTEEHEVPIAQAEEEVVPA
mgnify:CR=1 FL=1